MILHYLKVTKSKMSMFGETKKDVRTTKSKEVDITQLDQTAVTHGKIFLFFSQLSVRMFVQKGKQEVQR